MICELLKDMGVMSAWPDPAVPWEKRREELKKLIVDVEYGAPERREDRVSFETVREYPGYAAGKARSVQARIHNVFGDQEFVFTAEAFVPVGRGRVPFFVLIGGAAHPDCSVPVEEMIDRGFGLVSFNYQDVCIDYDMQKHMKTDATLGVYPYLFPSWKEGEPTYCHIAVWAWAASRVLDFAMTLPELDPEEAAVVGHSRLGKTALFAGVMDDRFRTVIANDSGCGGAGLYRYDAENEKKERWQDVAKNFPYWMSANYQKYVGKLSEVPLDQHFLVAACAPRRVYVDGADADIWADADAMYLTLAAASEVYERLGLPGFIAPDRLPVTGDVFREGRIGWHLRKGPHYMGREDWNRFMDFIRPEALPAEA